jgi:hypothetical protein
MSEQQRIPSAHFHHHVERKSYFKVVHWIITHPASTMKKIVWLSALQLLLSISFAQFNREQRIQDSVIGWWKKISIPKPKPPSNGQSLTIKQQEILVNFITWMQKSYTPVGGIGTYQLKSYKSKEESFTPAAYGVDFRVWNVSFDPAWLESNGDFKPVSEEYTRYDMSVNAIPGSYAIPFMNTATQFLFTWPPDGYNTNGDAVRETSLSQNANTGKFITRVNELNTVFLAPGNKLPFIAVSRGELLQLAEASVDREIQKRKIAIENKFPANIKAQNDAFEYVKKEMEKYRLSIQALKEKYENSLSEHAVLNNMQVTIYTFDGDVDPFIIKPNDQSHKNYFPVYTIEPAVLGKCRTDQPQWIAVSFPYRTKEDGNREYELYRSLTEHFNFAYAQNYFFAPGKMSAVAYHPLNEEGLNKTLDSYRNKNNLQKKTPENPLPANVYFMDNFSGNSDASKPAGWFFSTTGKHSAVTTLKNTPGKWVQLGYYNPLSSVVMKKPLPENFTLEYDIATDEFSGGKGGEVTLYLSSYPLRQDGQEDKNRNGTFVNITVTAGNENGYNNNNYKGAVKIEMHSSPSVNIENNAEGAYFTSELRQFTNNKTKVHVTFRVIDRELTLLINEKQVAASADLKMTYGKPCISCNLPVNTKFNTTNWKNTTSDYENVSVYISNIRITKH